MAIREDSNSDLDLGLLLGEEGVAPGEVYGLGGDPRGLILNHTTMLCPCGTMHHLLLLLLLLLLGMLLRGHPGVSCRHATGLLALVNREDCLLKPPEFLPQSLILTLEGRGPFPSTRRSVP